jgi:hypothetical protein
MAQGGKVECHRFQGENGDAISFLPFAAGHDIRPILDWLEIFAPPPGHQSSAVPKIETSNTDARL